MQTHQEISIKNEQKTLQQRDNCDKIYDRYNNNNNNNNKKKKKKKNDKNHQTQTLGSLNNFFTQIRSSIFIVSVHTS